MRLDAFGEWRPAPGRIVVFRPVADAVSQPLPGAPSFLQADHLGAYAGLRATGGHHRAWTGTVTELTGGLDEAALARALGAFVARHESLRTWFDLSRAAEGTVDRMVADPPAFAAVEVPGPADWDGGWNEAIAALYDEACTPDSWPGFLLGAVVRDGSWSMFWGSDHAFTDGASQLMAPVELSLLYAAETGEPADGLAAFTAEAGFPAYADAERARATTYTADSPEVRAWIDVVARHYGQLPRFPLSLGLEPGETEPEAIMRFDLLTGADVTRFEALCKGAGGRFTSGVYAALGVAEREVAGLDRYWGVTVLGTRDETNAASHGWFCNFAPVEFPIADGLLATVPAAEAALATARQVATMPVHAAIGFMLADGTTTPEQLYNPQMVSYLDLRRFPGADLPAYRNALHFTGEGRVGTCSMWINRDDTTLYLCFRVPDNGTARASAERYADAVETALAKALAG